MKKIICELLGLAGAAVLLAACAPITSLPRNSDADNARISAQKAEMAEMAAMQIPAYADAVAAEAEAAKAEAAKAIHDTDGWIRTMVLFTDLDRQDWKNGTASISLLNYDAQLIRMIVTTDATSEEHKRAPAWTKREDALLAARTAAEQADTAAVVEKNRQQGQMANNMAQLYESLSNQQEKENANRAAADQGYMNRMGAVAAPSCVPVSGQGWQGCAPSQP